MAKLKSDDKVIPFAEGAPSDDLIIEEIDSDNVLIGEKEDIEEPSSDFDSNLAGKTVIIQYIIVELLRNRSPS